MDEKQLFLTWNNHGSTYKSMFNMLRQKNILTDITLACDGRQFAAHQLVLATCSDYFQSILSSVSREGGGSCGGGAGHPIVYLRGVPAREMHAMLEFMYTGEARLPQSEVKALMETAKSLRIKGLGVMPEGEEEEKGSEKEQQKKESCDSKNQPCTDTNDRTLKSKGTNILDDQPPMKKKVSSRSLPILKKSEVKDSIQGRKRQLTVDVPRNDINDCSSSLKNNSTHHDLSAANRVLSPKKRKTSMLQENSITIVKCNRFSSTRRDLSHQGQHGSSSQVVDANKSLLQDHSLTDRDTLSELVHVKSEPNYLPGGQYEEFGEGPFCSDLESILDYTVIREAKVYQNLPRSARTDSKFGHQTNSRKASLKPSNEASSCLLHVQETDLQFQHPNPSSDQGLSSVNTSTKEYPIADWSTNNQHMEESVTGASPLLREAVDGVLSLEDGGFMAGTEELYPERVVRAIQPLVGGEGGENDCSMMAGGEAHADEELLDEGDVGAGMAATSIEEEAQLYLEAFTRSAGLSRSSLKLPHEEPLDDSPVHDNQEASTPSVEGHEDALAANYSPPSLPFLPEADGAEDTENRPYRCPICRKGFSKAAILKRHHLAHFRPYSCQLCQRSFTRREVLAEHLQEHSGADMRLPCPVCAMTIKRKRNLQAHIKVKHPDYYRHRVASNLAIC